MSTETIMGWSPAPVKWLCRDGISVGLPEPIDGYRLLSREDMGNLAQESRVFGFPASWKCSNGKRYFITSMIPYPPSADTLPMRVRETALASGLWPVKLSIVEYVLPKIKIGEIS